MDSEELTKIILEESPDAWPEELKPLGAPAEVMPPQVRANIQAMIQRAINEKNSGTAAEPTPMAPESAGNTLETSSVAGVSGRGRLYLVAALVPVILAVGAVWFFGAGSSTSGPNMEVARVTGNVNATLAGKKQKLAAGDSLRQGTTLELAANDSLSLKTRAGFFQIQGPALVELETLAWTGRPELTFYIKEGIVSVNSKHTGDKKVIWKTKLFNAQMTGTVARATIGKETHILEVLKGSFDIRFEKSSEVRRLKAGEVIYANANESAPPRGRKMEDFEVEDLKSHNRRLEALKSGKQTESEPPANLNTIEDLRRHYKTLHKIVLKGRENEPYTGRIIKKTPQLVRIHLPGPGRVIVEFARKDIIDITELKK